MQRSRPRLNVALTHPEISESFIPSSHRRGVKFQGYESTPWFLSVTCLLILLLPPYVVPLDNKRLWPPILMSIFLLALVILGFITANRERGQLTVKPGAIIVLVYFILQVAMYVTDGPGSAGVENIATGGIGRTLQFTIQLAAVGVALYTATHVTTTRQRVILLGTLLAGLVFSCVVGILQSYAAIDLRLLFAPPGFGEMKAVGVPRGSMSNVGSVERFSANRAYGTADHPIEFSALAAVTVPLAIHFRRYARNRYVRVLATLATIAGLMALLAGGSRSGIVALAVAMSIYVWTLKIRRIVATGVVAVVLGGALLLASAAVSRSISALWTAITSGAALEDSSITDRVARYAAVAQVFHSHPLLGLGAGRFPPGVEVLDNQWLKAIVEGGLVGLTSMIVLAVGGVFGIAAALRRASNSHERDLAYAMGAVFIGIMSTSMTVDIYTYAQSTLVMFFIFGLLWSPFGVSVNER